MTLMLNTDRPVVRLCSAPWHKIAPPLTLVVFHDARVDLGRGIQADRGQRRMRELVRVVKGGHDTGEQTNVAKLHSHWPKWLNPMRRCSRKF